jgi:hypothetical protein
VEFVEQVLLHKKRGVCGVPLEVLQEKRGVGLQLHVFLGAEFVELDVFGTMELERSWKNGSRAVPNTPLASHHSVPRWCLGFVIGSYFPPYAIIRSSCVFEKKSSVTSGQEYGASNHGELVWHNT